MANYKLIVSDLDGTLLNEKMEIGEKNDAAICEFARRGILFAPFSGRTRDEIPDTLINSPYVRYLSYSNGAVVYDKAEKKKIISNEISEHLSRKVIDVCKKYEVYIAVTKCALLYCVQGRP